MKSRTHLRLSGILTLSIIALVYIFWQNFANAADSQLQQYYNKVQQDTTIADDVKQKFLAALDKKILQEKRIYESSFDIATDSSFQKYVSDKDKLDDVTYEPVDLQKLGTDYIINKAYRPYLRAAAATAFDTMAKAFYEKFNRKLYVLSAYRSYSDQKNLITNGCEFERCAKAGGSEHQLWLAIDIHIATEKWGYQAMGGEYFNRLKDNAHLYGFHNTYSKGYDIDGKRAENRHRRYMGTPFATILHEKNITIWEYTKM